MDRRGDVRKCCSRHIARRTGYYRLRESCPEALISSASRSAPRYFFEIEAGDGFPDCWDINLQNREAARMHAIDLATARLEPQDDSSASPEVRIVIRDDKGAVLETLLSVTD